jgi:DNA-binding transcriptional LysR family regulator
LAGEELDMTQSAVSNGLRRLRMHFADPLFVKTPHGMTPTPLAERLAFPLQQAIDNIRVAIESVEVFDPGKIQRAFRIYMSDLGQLVLIPRLLRILDREASGVSLEVVDALPRAAQSMMAEGSIDIAIGTFAAFQAGFHSQRMFSKTYVVLARRGHPALHGGLSLEAFLRARHAIYHPPAGSHDDFEAHVAAIFQQHNARRRVAVELAHGLGIVETIESSDLLISVPARLAQSYAAHADVETAALPFKSPTIDVSQFLHHRFHADEGHQWLRGLVFKNYSRG